MTSYMRNPPAGHILVGIDGSASSLAALRWAIEEAAYTGSGVEAINVYTEPALVYAAPGYIAPDRGRIMDYSHDLIRSAMEHIPEKRPDVRVISRTERGYPGEILANNSASPDVTEVVVGARTHGPFANLIAGSVVNTLSHRCYKPLVIVPSTWAPEAGPKQASPDQASPDQASPDGSHRGKIVVGVDGSEESVDALEWALREASLRSSVAEAVMAWAPPSPVLPAHMPLEALVAASHSRSELLAWLDSRIAGVSRGDVPLEVKILQGQAPEVLRSEAAGAQMLVVGRRHHALLHELTHGSVSHGCVKRAPLPVVVVPGHR